MRPGSEIISLGEHQWSIRPLTLRQVQDIEPILLDGAANGKGNVAAAMAIVAIAMQRDHADWAARLEEIEATAAEIAAAMAAVLRLGGFLAASGNGDAAAGEASAGAPAEAAPASTSI